MEPQLNSKTPMNTRRSLVLTTVLGLVAGCGGPPAVSPGQAGPPALAAHYRAALDKEIDDPMSFGPYLDLLDEAVANPGAPGALAAGEAALDALVLGTTAGLEGAGRTALAFRSREV